MSTGFYRPSQLLDGQKGEVIWDGPSLTNIDFNDRASIPEGFIANIRKDIKADTNDTAEIDRRVEQKLKDLGILAKYLDARGMANASTTQDMLDMHSSSSNIVDKTNAGMGFAFHQAERFARQITAMATYELILKNKRNKSKDKELTEKEYEDLVNEVILEVEHTNSGAMTETAPKIARNSIGSVLLMYKRFGISMLYLQFRMLRDALKGVPKGERNFAKHQIVGLFATSGLLSGVQGLPAYGMIAAMANMFLLDDEDDDADSIAAEFFGEGPYSGLLNATFGMDVAPRIGMTNLIYRTLPNRDQGKMALFAELAGGPIYGIGVRMGRGLGYTYDGEIARGLESLFPSGLANGFKAIRYAREGPTTLRGDPIVKDMNPLEITGQFFGFAPAGYIKQLEMNARDKRVDRNIAERKSNILRTRYLALREGDFDEVRDLNEEIMDFNGRHPESAITGETITRSTRQHRVTDIMTRMLGGITVNRNRYQKVIQKRIKELGEEEFFAFD
tara:strand:- start:45 stop:1556 length:1512 start_codon:yes stop_codon:yes gene_type:complete